MKTRTRLSVALLAAALAASSGFALSQGGPQGPGPGYGGGMMGGGYGGGMMGGGHGGMMGGGHGGMMGGGHGGMMGGGHGGGMAGGYAALDLTDDQRQKLSGMGEDARRKSWDAMGQLRSEQYRLRELLRADPVNASAVVDQQGKVDGLRRQILKARIESRNEMAAVLTPDQRKRLRASGPWWYQEDAVE